MKKLLTFLIVCIFMIDCTNNNNFERIVSKEWTKCDGDINCTIDFAVIMPFEWDTMYYYSGANSLEDINKDLGFELKEFADIEDRILFLKNNKVVYQKEWFNNPDEELKGVIFVTDLKTFKVDKSNAKFKLRKQGKAFYLKKK